MQNAGDRPCRNGEVGKIIELPERSEGKQENGPDAGVHDSMKKAQLSYDLRKIREAVENAPDIREEKVALIKKMIASGEYSVHAREVADKMIQEFLPDDSLKS
jgi:negative regulator of flagellin synthesis FlgM